MMRTNLAPTINEIRFQAEERRMLQASHFNSRRVPKFRRNQLVSFITDSGKVRTGRITSSFDIDGFITYHIMSDNVWFRYIHETEVKPL